MMERYRAFVFPPSVSFLGNRVNDCNDDKNDFNSPLIAASNNIDATPLTKWTWKDELQHNKNLYNFACWTGVIYPVDINESDGTTRHNGGNNPQRWRQNWVIFMHISLLLELIVFFINIPFLSISKIYSPYKLITIIIGWAAGYVPLFTMLPAIICLRHAIFNRNLIPPVIRKLIQLDIENPKFKSNIDNSSSEKSSGKIDMSGYLNRLVQSTIQKSLPLSKRLTYLYLFNSWSFIMLDIIITISVAFANSSSRPLINVGDSSTESHQLYPLLALNMIVILFGVFPAILMFVGIFAFVLLDQHWSYAIVRLVYDHTVDLYSDNASRGPIPLTSREYWEIGKYLEHSHGSNYVLNWLFTGSAFDSMICIIMLITFAFTNLFPRNEIIFFALFIALIFFQQLLTMFMILFRVLKVNEVVDNLFIQLTRHAFATERDGRGKALYSDYCNNEDNDCDSQHDVESSSSSFPVIHQLQCMQLISMIRDYRIGTSIWFYRPTKIQLLLQMSSVMLVLSTTLLRIFVKGIE